MSSFVLWEEGQCECSCEYVCRKRRAQPSRSDFIRFLTASFRLAVLEYYYLGSFSSIFSFEKQVVVVSN